MIALGMPGPFEITVILIVVMLLFGHRIPGMARSLGSGIVEFKKGLRSGDAPADDASAGLAGNGEIPQQNASGVDSSKSSVRQDEGHGVGG